MEDHSPEFQLFLSIFSKLMAFPRCVPNVHHLLASKPVLVWQSFQWLLHTPLSGWLLFLLWWQFSVPQLFVDFPGMHCLWGNPTDKNLGGLRSGECRAHFSSHLLLMSLSSNLCLNQARISLAVWGVAPSCWNHGETLRTPLRRPSDAQYLFRTAM